MNRSVIIELPKTKRDPAELAALCLCRPICKSRRRIWNDQLLNTSAELLLDRKPIAECFRRCPTKIYPNSPCPLFGKSHRVIIKERNTSTPHRVVRICEAPVDDRVDLRYLRYADMAMQLGAWQAVKDRCAFCRCGSCCPCSSHEYELRDADRNAQRRKDMRNFDARVKTDCTTKVMYN